MPKITFRRRLKGERIDAFRDDFTIDPPLSVPVIGWYPWRHFYVEDRWAILSRDIDEAKDLTPRQRTRALNEAKERLKEARSGARLKAWR